MYARTWDRALLTELVVPTGAPQHHLPTEAEEQKAVVAFIKEINARRPRAGLLPILYTHPRNEGRVASERQRGAALGTIPGVCDLILLQETLQGHPIAGIELKRQRGGRLTPEQAAWLAEMAKRGYATAVCRGAVEAIDRLVLWYGRV
jgi:hypothetical protein